VRFWAISDGQQAFTVHLVQHRTQRAGADVVAVAGQLSSHPRAINRRYLRVVQDMQPRRARQELAHRRASVVRPS